MRTLTRQTQAFYLRIVEGTPKKQPPLRGAGFGCYTQGSYSAPIYHRLLDSAHRIWQISI
jgi:hypothetical protein